LGRKKDQALLKDLVLMRLANPSSKLKAQQLLAERFARTHDLDAIYRVMDKLFSRIGEMKALTFQGTKRLIPGTIDILFFDSLIDGWKPPSSDGKTLVCESRRDAIASQVRCLSTAKPLIQYTAIDITSFGSRSIDTRY